MSQSGRHVGAGGAIGTPYKRKKRGKLGKQKKLFNRYHTKAHTLGERGAALKRWHNLRKARCSPIRLTAVVQAVLTRRHQAGWGWNQLSVCTVV